jgi:hypothetical protein
MFGSRRDAVTRDYRYLCNELYNFHSPLKSRRIRWAGECGTRGTIKCINVKVGKYQKQKYKKQKKSRCRWKDNIQKRSWE